MIPGLDRWLTTEPDNGYDKWAEEVFDCIPEDELSQDDYEEFLEYIDYLLYREFLRGRKKFPYKRNTAHHIIYKIREIKEILKEYDNRPTT